MWAQRMYLVAANDDACDATGTTAKTTRGFYLLSFPLGRPKAQKYTPTSRSSRNTYWGSGSASLQSGTKVNNQNSAHALREEATKQGTVNCTYIYT